MISGISRNIWENGEYSGRDSMLSQTYISRKTSLSKKGQLPKAKYVYVTVAFNPRLAPSEGTLTKYETSGKTSEAWEIYKPEYIQKILSDPIALEKIDKLIEESLNQDVVLMCFESEKNYGKQCHRFLLLDIAEDRAREKGILIEIKRENYLLS